MPPILTTRRLTLRPITSDDAVAIARGMSNWEVVQWLSAPPFPYSVADAHYFIDEIVPTATNWAIEAVGTFIGVIGVKPDLGYWLDVDYHGQHIMSEAARAVVAWYFDTQSEDLISGHFVSNEASRKVLLGLGFADTEIVDEVQTATSETVKLQRMVLTKAVWEWDNA